MAQAANNRNWEVASFLKVARSFMFKVKKLARVLWQKYVIHGLKKEIIQVVRLICLTGLGYSQPQPHKLKSIAELLKIADQMAGSDEPIFLQNSTSYQMTQDWLVENIV